MGSVRQFKLESGAVFSGLCEADYQKLWQRLTEEMGLLPLQIYEAAAFSAAMVLRVALGLSASGAKLAALIDDCRAGSVAVATLRILANSGANCSVLSVKSLKDISDDYERQLKLADKCGVQIAEIQPNELPDTLEHISNCHALLLGLYTSSASESLPQQELLQGINELQTPVHVIEAPPGVDPNTGQRVLDPTFAATTIALGMPLIGLAEGKEFCGRTYLCDISIPQTLYLEFAPALSGFFASQPVNQIFPA